MPTTWHRLPTLTATLTGTLARARVSMPSGSELRRGALALLAILGLLLAFQLVVRQQVRQGETRHHSTALIAEGTWRCMALRESRLRSPCLAHLREVANDNAGLQRLVSSLAAASAGSDR